MTEPVGWRTAFAAFGVLLGEPAEAIASALGEPPAGGDAADAGLASPSRATRARAVASVVTRVVAELEGARLR